MTSDSRPASPPIECVALIVAAGRGTRAASGMPKQYRPVGGRSVLRRGVEVFVSHPRIDAVRVVTHQDDRAHYDDTCGNLGLLEPVGGGESRQDSVRLGLESLAALAPRTVLIHDAARPFVTHAVIDATLAALAHAPGAIPALPVADSLKRARDDRIEASIDRAGLWRAQTPQAFRFADILAAHRRFIGANLTDDAAVAEAAGLAVSIVAGDEANHKLTTEADFARAERLLAGASETRVGTGFDVHRFGPGAAVRLCGVDIAHGQGLIGHSDADVALHALTDALLGAIGAGDIGVHFPAGDPRWKGADSAVFLRHAADLVRARGGAIAHVDLTIICERPRILPHRAAMLARLATILDLPPERCSLKATTTEGLGFTGRGEGIAAQAAATIRLPA